MKSTFRKSSLRFVKQKFSRFIAMFGIVFIGIFVISGLVTTTPNIKSTINDYYNDSNTIDINLKSTIGFNKQSIDIISEIDGINKVEGINYLETNVIYETNNLVAIVYENNFNSESYLNYLTYVEGLREPLSSNEILVEQSSYYLKETSIGDIITIDSIDYTIRGIVSNSWHFAKEKERTNQTLETVDLIIYKQIDLKSTLYTDLFIRANLETDTFSSKYNNQIKLIEDAIMKKESILLNNQIDYLKILNQLLEIDVKNESIIYLNRNTNISFVTFSEFINKVDTIIRVFPIFFLVVSSLVVLTTMTRLVDEERLQIGLLRALGYTKNAIYLKYITYAAAISILASLFGYLIGFRLFPSFIYNTFDNSFHLPTLNLDVYSTVNLILVIVMVLSIVTTTIAAVRTTLNQEPADLLLPRAPKKGQRVFLERIPFLWNKLKFKYKASFRNIFRYPKHLFMTIVGVTGSFSLIFIALGLNYSIEQVNKSQYEEFYQYDYIININNNDHTSLLDYLNNNKQSYFKFFEVTDYSIDKDGNHFNYDVIVASNKNELSNFINMVDLDNKQVQLNDNGVIITNQVAEALNLTIGDSITLISTNQTLLVSNIIKHYVSNKMYMTKEYYDNYFTNPYSENKIFVTNHEDISNYSIKDSILSLAAANGIDFLDDEITANKRLLGQVTSIVIVLVVASGVLFIIIVYNLTNVNVYERAKELSTLKVLGYRDSEVSMYIFREIIIMTIMGIALGLIAGRIFLNYVIKEINSYNLSFVSEVNLLVYIISICLIIVFTFLVQLLMHFKIKKIDMIEALKEY